MSKTPPSYFEIYGLHISGRNKLSKIGYFTNSFDLHGEYPVSRTSLTQTRRTPNPRLLEQDSISPGFNPIFSSHLLTATPKRRNVEKLPQSLKDGIMSRPKDQESQKKIKCTHPNLPLWE